MAMTDYEISSGSLTEKEDDYDPELYEEGSAEAMGAYYTHIANSLTRIRTALNKTADNEKIRDLTASDKNINVYHMLIDSPYLMKNIKDAMASDIVLPSDENNLLELYINKIADMISQIEYVYPERYMELMHRILPSSVTSYYEQVITEESDNPFEYTFNDNDVQFYNCA